MKFNTAGKQCEISITTWYKNHTSWLNVVVGGWSYFLMLSTCKVTESQLE